MIFPIPIYVEEIPSAANQPGRFTVRPLFAKEPVQSGEKLTRALTRLANDLQLQLKALSEDGRHDDLAEWAYSPLLEERTLDLRIELGSNTQRRAFFFRSPTGTIPARLPPASTDRSTPRPGFAATCTRRRADGTALPQPRRSP